MNNTKTYIGVKQVKGTPMSIGDYNNLRGWDTPDNKNRNTMGYLVEYLDGGKPNLKGYKGYVSWSPKEQYENAYRPTDGMNFGLAVEAMKKGLKVCRAGWSEKGMFTYYIPADKYPLSRNLKSGNLKQTMKSLFKDDLVPYRHYLALKTAQDDVAIWSPSTSDALADDWMIVD